ARRWTAADLGATFVTRTPELRAALDAAEREAGGPDAGPWIIAGPPGSGRRTVAGWLHARSPLADQPLLLFSASGDAATDVASLFGVADGVGDGALGALEAAGRGMVVVDGWSRLDSFVRDSLHRAAVDGEARRGGGGAGLVASAPAGDRVGVPLDARLCLCVDDVSVLPASLAAAAAVVVHLPPLLDRAADIGALAEHFLRLAGRGAVTLHDDATGALAGHDWPGQVAELRDVIAAAVWRLTDTTLRAAHLALPAAAAGTVGGAGLAAPTRPAASLAELEHEQIAAVLDEVGWHRGRAAARLGISVRTLYRRIRQLGFSPGGGGAPGRPGGTVARGSGRARRTESPAPSRARATGTNMNPR
ncbi:MAG: helix-turn-helix domain-containing protein, partial [Gemmatimonadaceae bacterium]